MRAVIYRRSEVENGSLLLNVFTETGKTKKLKIPGILKSKTRNAFFLAPATLWEFTFIGNDKEIVTPKEFSLIHSPYDFNTGYKALVCIGEILKPLTCLRPDLEITPLFDDLSDILFRWKCGDKTTENFLTNEFYLKFLNYFPIFINFSDNFFEILTQNSQKLLRI
jgi:recombinational DNA repair protein (RecF pathway)